MKIMRSTKCSLKFATHGKHEQLSSVLAEYGSVVNTFIAAFWEKCPKKGELLKPIVDLPMDRTWLSARLRKVAAREAIDMVKASRERDGDKAVPPLHRGARLCCSSTIATLQPAKEATEFDAWLHLSSIGNKIRFTLPIRFHRHFNRLAAKGRRLNSYVITKEYVQFCFEVDTGPKLADGEVLGLDTGIKALASLSDGQQFGRDIEDIIDAIKRCRWGSKRQRRLRRSLRQRMDEIAKQVFRLGPRLVVVEKLKRMNHRTAVKRRLTKNMRRTLGAWAYRYWLDRVQRGCEDNRVVFRSVPPQYTSQRCHACGHTERKNRSGETFRCRKCGHCANADINAALNILDRFLLGPYGAEYQPSGYLSG